MGDDMPVPAMPQSWMALCIWDEARDQPADGMAAVGQIILNRAARKYQSDGSVRGTVLHPMAFSGFWCDMVNGKYTRVAHTESDAVKRAAAKLKAACADPKLWARILDIAHDVIKSEYKPAGGDFAKVQNPDVVLYANLNVSHPDWAVPKAFVCKIGAHSFYRDPV